MRSQKEQNEFNKTFRMGRHKQQEGPGCVMGVLVGCAGVGTALGVLYLVVMFVSSAWSAGQ